MHIYLQTISRTAHDLQDNQTAAATAQQRHEDADATATAHKIEATPTRQQPRQRAQRSHGAHDTAQLPDARRRRHAHDIERRSAAPHPDGAPPEATRRHQTPANLAT
jgi:hypothetical protein